MLQLSLPLHQLDGETFANFYGNNNLLLLDSLRKNSTRLRQQFFYIWGEEGCGKSHLLKAATHQFFGENRTALYVPLAKSVYFSPAVLDNLEQQELVCLDDLQCVIGNEEWEVAVFDLFNRIKEHGKTLLIVSANQSPNSLPVQLPDLASRLSWGEIYQLHALDDQQKITALQQNARQRGIELPDETASFLIKRLDRNMHNLFAVLDQLDKASLQAQRKLTIPFVKETLGL
ncbi:Chromosomal replication initiator DnaA [Actinobacillus succinogenes 130Z]|uniref:Chromosomal replication initiator DnaA n=1 Tax=Actinobacillus succinogenes (strain ATCC 55618 / DSM 22257 / CCUG 43843 / 130Z) TaxID=339671 RepID=A6VQG5_ACTSZ|nr:Chromosomal replication initiator DnaA [Actinobacillus succinogenes 130Z]